MTAPNPSRNLLAAFDRPTTRPPEAATETEDLLTTKTAGVEVVLEDLDLDDPAIYPLEPKIDTTQREFDERFVDYGTRGPRDVVLSGPIVGGWGPGRYYRNRRTARMELQAKYGRDRVRETEGVTRGRWSFLIKNLKEVA